MWRQEFERRGDDNKQGLLGKQKVNCWQTIKTNLLPPTVWSSSSKRLNPVNIQQLQACQVSLSYSSSVKRHKMKLMRITSEVYKIWQPIERDMIVCEWKIVLKVHCSNNETRFQSCGSCIPETSITSLKKCTSDLRTLV